MKFDFLVLSVPKRPELSRTLGREQRMSRHFEIVANLFCRLWEDCESFAGLDREHTVPRTFVPLYRFPIGET